MDNKGHRMGLREELGFPKAIELPDHEALMSLVMSGTLLAKEGALPVLAPEGES